MRIEILILLILSICVLVSTLIYHYRICKLWEKWVRITAIKKEIESREEMPTVDAERHGRWVMDKGYNECSICGCNEVITPYCPNCGAKMDEVE